MDKAKRICSIPDCGKRHVAKGWCWKHYERNRQHGNPLAVKTAPDGALLDFIKRAGEQKSPHCILWPYGKNGDGYGVLRHEGTLWTAHRLSLTIHKGPAPSGKPLAAHAPVDCHNRGCVNPNHLRWANHSDNLVDRHIDAAAAHYAPHLAPENRT